MRITQRRVESGRENGQAVSIVLPSGLFVDARLVRMPSGWSREAWLGALTLGFDRIEKVTRTGSAESLDDNSPEIDFASNLGDEAVFEALRVNSSTASEVLIAFLNQVGRIQHSVPAPNDDDDAVGVGGADEGP